MSTVTAFLNRASEDDALLRKVAGAEGDIDALVAVAKTAGCPFTTNENRIAVTDIMSRVRSFFDRVATDASLRARIEALEQWDLAGVRRITEDAGYPISPGELQLAVDIITTTPTSSIKVDRELGDADIKTSTDGKGDETQTDVPDGFQASPSFDDVFFLFPHWR